MAAIVLPPATAALPGKPPSPQGLSSDLPPDLTSPGLTSSEAARSLRTVGQNEMPDKSVHPVSMAAEKFWAPFPWMLQAAIILQLALGKYIEAAIIAGLLIFNAALGLFQEGRAQATLAALK